MLGRRSADVRHAFAIVVAEQEARGQGRVVEKDGVVQLDWSISEKVVGSIKRSIAAAAKWAGASAVTFPQGDIRDRLWTAAHHSGCCRIADDPADGVVDANLRVHGTKSVYVCDGSVLPSTGATNSALTIGCLALRLADHVAPARSIGIAHAGKSSVDVLVTGSGGNVGSILLPDLMRSGLSYDVVSLRGGVTSTAPEARTLIHLANDASSWEANSKIQRDAAAVASSASVANVIVTMTFATLQIPGPRAGDPSEFNFGFDVRLHDSYIDGKLEAERFWCNWQSEHPDRKVVFVYIPTICGPRNFWTPHIAASSPGKPMWVPALEHYFSVTEENLATALLNLAGSARQSVQRLVLFDRSDSLAKTIIWERGTPDVKEFPFPHFIARGSRTRQFRRAMTLAQKVADKALHVTVGHQMIRTSQLYLALFREQVQAARQIHEAAERSQWERVVPRQAPNGDHA